MNSVQMNNSSSSFGSKSSLNKSRKPIFQKPQQDNCVDPCFTLRNNNPDLIRESHIKYSPFKELEEQFEEIRLQQPKFTDRNSQFQTQNESEQTAINIHAPKEEKIVLGGSDTFRKLDKNQSNVSIMQNQSCNASRRSIIRGNSSRVIQRAETIGHSLPQQSEKEISSSPNFYRPVRMVQDRKNMTHEDFYKSHQQKMPANAHKSASRVIIGMPVYTQPLHVTPFKSTVNPIIPSTKQSIIFHNQSNLQQTNTLKRSTIHSRSFEPIIVEEERKVHPGNSGVIVEHPVVLSNSRMSEHENVTFSNLPAPAPSPIINSRVIIHEDPKAKEQAQRFSRINKVLTTQYSEAMRELNYLKSQIHEEEFLDEKVFLERSLNQIDAIFLKETTDALYKLDELGRRRVIIQRVAQENASEGKSTKTRKNYQSSIVYGQKPVRCVEKRYCEVDTTVETGFGTTSVSGSGFGSEINNNKSNHIKVDESMTGKIPSSCMAADQAERSTAASKAKGERRVFESIYDRNSNTNLNYRSKSPNELSGEESTCSKKMRGSMLYHRPHADSSSIVLEEGSRVQEQLI